LVEQLICNQQVIGSSPIAGSLFRNRTAKNSSLVLDVLQKPDETQIDASFVCRR